MRLILLNKPFQVLPQFTSPDDRRCLRDFVPLHGVYPAGRLDYDSEGLLLLTDYGPLAGPHQPAALAVPEGLLAQVEGVPDDASLQRLRDGVVLNDGPTLPARARRVPEPAWLWPRDPPIRVRKAIPTSWIELELREGRNRQVRRMTAAVGHPTLRLIRLSVGPWSVQGLAPGQWRELPHDGCGTGAGGGPDQPERAFVAIRIASSRACS